MLRSPPLLLILIALVVATKARESKNVADLLISTTYEVALRTDCQLKVKLLYFVVFAPFIGASKVTADNVKAEAFGLIFPVLK